MSKKWFILLFAALIALFLFYTWFMNRIDTKYAVEFANVFSTYDIHSIDNYLTDETIIICNNKQIGRAHV